MPTPGIVHNHTKLWAFGQVCTTKRLLHGTKNKFAKFPVEKLAGTPYGTRSYLPGGTVSENRIVRRQGLPPVFLVRKVARKTLSF
jgi:hypothetical protein